MKHKFVLVAASCLLCVFAFTFASFKINPAASRMQATMFSEEASDDETSADTTQGKHDDGIDVLDIMREMNGDDQPKPSPDFRDGHVSDADISDYLTKTENGYIIKLPGITNVPTATVLDGKLYVSGGFGSKQYFSFNAQTGEKLWAVDIDDDGPSSGVVDDDVLVFNTESCTIFAVERSTGRHLWSHWLGDPLMSMPAIANGMVFTAYPSYLNSEFMRDVKDSAYTHTFTATHVLAAFDLKTGKTLWQQWIDGDVMSAPVAKGNELFITTFPGTVYKFNQQTGGILSAKYMRATSAPVINDDDIIVSRTRYSSVTTTKTESIAYMSTKSAKVTRQYMNKDAEYLEKDVQDKSGLKSVAMDMDAGNGFGNGAPASSGAEQAAENVGQSNVSSLQSFQGSRTVIYEGLNYTTMGDEIICTNPVGGTTMWSAKLEGDMRESGGFLGTPPLSAGGYIIIATLTGEIQLINAKTGAIEKKYATGSSIRYQPVVDAGWIYATTTDGKVIAINTNNRAITGWSMWGADAAHSNAVE